MTELTPALLVVAGLAAGALLTWLLLRGQAANLRRQLEAEARAERATLDERASSLARLLEQEQAEQQRLGVQHEAQLAALRAQLDALGRSESELGTRLEAERSRHAEQLQLLEQAQQRLSDAFKALSAEALKSNNQSFLELAKQSLATFQEAARGDLEKRQQAIDALVQPVAGSLEKMGQRLGELEQARTEAYAEIRTQIAAVRDSGQALRDETANLVKALRAPQVRGRWGEIQLRRVVELAGMVDHCDFYEQTSVEVEGGKLRPDLLIRLPGGKNIVVDAKTPLSAYLEAIEAADDAGRLARLQEHARQVRQHMGALGKKSYWDQFEPSPEFVVLFLPGETFFSAALEQDPGLIEAGVDQSVILATPTTLIALLRAVAYGWRQERLADNARAISALGAELYERLAKLGEHFGSVGKNLGRAVEAYNQAVGSLETRVLVSARRFQELDAAPASKPLRELEPVDSTVRGLQAPELAAPDEGEPVN